jgi:hypothetical protein
VNVIGSYVVFDPTGRDLYACMEVGVVENIIWDIGDDGNPDGTLRPVLLVRPNSDEEPYAVIRVHAVLGLDDSPNPTEYERGQLERTMGP